jgi:hypothetical protein
LNDGGEMELVARAGKATQSRAFESVMRLQVGKAHLDPLPLIARFQVWGRAEARIARVRSQ